MNLPPQNQLAITIPSKKDLDFQKILKNSLMKWQEEQNTFSSDVISAVMVKYQQNENWTALMAQNKFDIEQAVQVSAADWVEFSESTNYPATIENAVSNIVPSIAVFRKYHDESAALGVISKMVLWTLRMLNVQKSQDDFQIMMTSKMILSDYYFLKLSEIKYCFVRGIHGDFGQLYAKVDAMDLLKWLKEYCEQRSAYLIQENQKQSQNQKELLKSANYNPDMFKMLKGTIDKIEGKEQERKQQQKIALMQTRIQFAERRLGQLKEMESSDIIQSTLEYVKSEIESEIIIITNLKADLKTELCKN